MWRKGRNEQCRLRTLLIDAAHGYRLPARIARNKLAAVGAVPDAIPEVAWKAQTRLCRRYRQMMATGTSIKLYPLERTDRARDCMTAIIVTLPSWLGVSRP